MQNRPHLIPALIVAIMLLVAAAPLPYGYFQFLRWAVCGVAIFIAVKSYAWKQTWAIWLFGAVAVLFNPILPIDLTREIWRPIDLAGALLFSLSILLLPELAAKSIGWITTIALSLFLMLAGISLLSAYNAASNAASDVPAAIAATAAWEAAWKDAWKDAVYTPTWLAAYDAAWKDATSVRNAASDATAAAAAAASKASGTAWFLGVVFLLGSLVFLVISFVSGLKIGNTGSNRLLFIISIALLLSALLTVGYVW